jgi:hypothetical protein
VLSRWLYSTCRVSCLSAAFVALILSSGCAVFEKGRWNLDRFRDERAVDIERRLERDEPIVENPF